MQLTECWKTDLCIPKQGAEDILCTSKCDLVSYSMGNTELRIDACNKNELSLLFWGFGGPSLEHWTTCYGKDGSLCGSAWLNEQGNIEVTAMGQYTNMILQEAGIKPTELRFELNSDDIKFTMPLHNNSAEAGSLQIVQMSNDKEWVLKLDIKIWHTPINRLVK